ncbi:MAG: potassium channel family protein [archaeon]
MKEAINLNDMMKYVRKRGFSSWLDRFSFWHILFIWVIVIAGFGVIYYYFSSPTMHLLDTSTKLPVNSLLDTIYFSFVTATTTGFGDILPIGIFKLLAMFEVIGVLLLLALVTSKLVSIKQDAILGELYDISLNERINRLRSSLLLFRQNLSRIMVKIEENTIKKREISELYIYISSLEDVLAQTLGMIAKNGKKKGFTKSIDAVNTELIINSIFSSFEKLNELISLLNESKIDWKRDVTLNLINKCLNEQDLLMNNAESSHYLNEKIMTELKARNLVITSSLKKGLVTVTQS